MFKSIFNWGDGQPSGANNSSNLNIDDLNLNLNTTSNVGKNEVKELTKQLPPPTYKVAKPSNPIQQGHVVAGQHHQQPKDSAHGGQESSTSKDASVSEPQREPSQKELISKLKHEESSTALPIIPTSYEMDSDEDDLFSPKKKNFSKKEQFNPFEKQIGYSEIQQKNLTTIYQKYDFEEKAKDSEEDDNMFTPSVKSRGTELFDDETIEALLMSEKNKKSRPKGDKFMPINVSLFKDNDSDVPLISGEITFDSVPKSPPQSPTIERFDVDDFLKSDFDFKPGRAQKQQKQEEPTAFVPSKPAKPVKPVTKKPEPKPKNALENDIFGADYNERDDFLYSIPSNSKHAAGVNIGGNRSAPKKSDIDDKVHQILFQEEEDNHKKQAEKSKKVEESKKLKNDIDDLFKFVPASKPSQPQTANISLTHSNPNVNAKPTPTNAFVVASPSNKAQIDFDFLEDQFSKRNAKETPTTPEKVPATAQPSKPKKIQTDDIFAEWEKEEGEKVKAKRELKKKEEEAERKKKEDEEELKRIEEEAERKKKAQAEEAERKKKAEAEEAERKRVQEEARKKRLEEEAAEKKRQEELAEKKKLEAEAAERKKQEQIAAERKKQEELAEKKRQEEIAKKKKLEEEAAERKRQEEIAEKKRQEELAAERQRQEEIAKKKKIEEEAAEKKRQEELAAEKKRQEQIAAEKKKQEEAIERKKQEELAAEKKRQEEIKKKQEEDLRKKKLEEEAAAERKKQELAAEKKRQEEIAAEKKRQEEEEAKRKKKLEEEAIAAAAEKKRQEQIAAEKKKQDEEAERKRQEQIAAEKKKKEEEESARKKKLEEEAAAERKRQEQIAAEKKRQEEEEAKRKKKIEEEAEKKRLEEIAIEKKRKEDEETARKKKLEEEAERKRQEQIAAEKKKQEEEVERKRQEQIAAEKKKKEEELAAAEKKKKEDAERKRQEEEAERKRQEQIAAEKKRQEEEEASKKKKLEEEAAERKRQEQIAAEKKKSEEEAAERKRQEQIAAEKKKSEEDSRKKKDNDKKPSTDTGLLDDLVESSDHSDLVHLTIGRSKPKGRKKPKRREIQKDGSRKKEKLPNLKELEPSTNPSFNSSEGPESSSESATSSAPSTKKPPMMGMGVMMPKFDPSAVKLKSSASSISLSTPKSAPSSPSPTPLKPSAFGKTNSSLSLGGSANTSPTSSPSTIKKPAAKDGAQKALDSLLTWCKENTQGYPGVEVKDFTKSWDDGLAYCALFDRFKPGIIKDFSALSKNKKEVNYDLAFTSAQKHLGVPALMDADDLKDLPYPERLSNITYLSEFYKTIKKKGII